MLPNDFLELITKIKKNRNRCLDLRSAVFAKKQADELIKVLNENTSIVHVEQCSVEYRKAIQKIIDRNIATAKQNYLKKFRKNNPKLIDEEILLKLIDKYFYRITRYNKYVRDIELGRNDIKVREARDNFYYDTLIIRKTAGLIAPTWTVKKDSSCEHDDVSDGVLKDYLKSKMAKNGRYYGDELSDDSDDEDEKNYASDQKSDRIDGFKKIDKIAQGDFWEKNKQVTPQDEGLRKKLSSLVESIKARRLSAPETILKELNKILKNLKAGPNTGPAKDNDGEKIKGLFERARITPTEQEQRALDQLNQIRSENGCLKPEDIEQVKKACGFDEIFVAQYRGNNYMLDRWSADSRRYHRGVNEVGLPQFSEVVLKTLPYCFYTELNKENDFRRHRKDTEHLASTANILQAFLHGLDFTQPVVDYTDEAEKQSYLFDSVGDRLQHRFSNGINAHLTQLHLLRTKYPDYWGRYLPSAHNPSVATGNVPYHALKYAYGLKDYYAHPLLPRYHKDGFVEYPHAGKFYASLHPLSALLTGPVKRVSKLDSQGQVVILRDIAPEKETSFLSFVPANTVFYQFVVKYPSFKGKHGFIRRVKYGLDQRLYDAFAYLITYSQPKKFSEPEIDIREAVVELLREWLCAYYEVLLIEIATEEARKRGGFLVYLNQENDLSFTPDKNWFANGPANKDNRIGVHARRELRSYCAENICGQSPMKEDFSFYGFRLISRPPLEQFYRRILNTQQLLKNLALRVASTDKRQPNDENSLNRDIIPILLNILNEELTKIIGPINQQQRAIKDKKNQVRKTTDKKNGFAAEIEEKSEEKRIFLKPDRVGVFAATLQEVIFDRVHIDDFVTAAEIKDIELVRKYLDLGINVNSVGSNGHTALMEAAIEGCNELVNLLLEYKVNVNFHPKNEDSPVALAAVNCQFETVKMLVSNGADVNSRNDISDLSKRTPLYYAAEKNEVETLEFLLKKGANVNAQDVDGFTPLMIADCYNSEDAIECLLKKDHIDLSIKDNEGKTVIDWALETKKTVRAERYKKCLAESEQEKLRNDKQPAKWCAPSRSDSTLLSGAAEVTINQTSMVPASNNNDLEQSSKKVAYSESAALKATSQAKTSSTGAVPVLSSMGIGGFTMSSSKLHTKLLLKAMPKLNKEWHSDGETCKLACNDEIELQHITATLTGIFSNTTITVSSQNRSTGMFVVLKTANMSVEDLNKLLALHRAELAKVSIPTGHASPQKKI